MKQMVKAPFGTFNAIFVLTAANFVLANGVTVGECSGRVPVLLRSRSPAWCAALMKEKECVKAYTQKPKAGPRECVWETSLQKCVVGNVCATECAKINAFGEGIITLGKPDDCRLGSHMAAGSSCNVKCDESKGFSAGVGTYECAGRGAPAFTSLKCRMLSTAITIAPCAASTTATLATPTVASMTNTTTTTMIPKTASAEITTTSTTPSTITVKTSVSTTIPTQTDMSIASATTSTTAAVLAIMSVKSGIMGMQEKTAITPAISKLSSHTVDSTMTKNAISKIFATDGDNINTKAKTTTFTTTFTSSATQQKTPVTTKSITYRTPILNTIQSFLGGENLFMLFIVASGLTVGLLCSVAIFICVLAIVCKTDEPDAASSDTLELVDVSVDVISEIPRSSFDVNVDVVASVAPSRSSSSSIQQHTPVPREYFDDECFSSVGYDQPKSLNASLKTRASTSTSPPRHQSKYSHPFSQFLVTKDVRI